MTIIKWAAAALLTLTAGIATEAEPNKPQAIIPAETEEDLFEMDDDGDIIMPSLAELLGAPVDNLGMLSGIDGIESEIVDYAKTFLGTRYRLGAKGPKMFDCSGFTSYVFRNFNLSLGASSRIQATQGERVDIADARPGDLVFFSGRRAGKTVGHVGIVVSVDPATSSVKFIHAATSRGVRIDTYPDGGYYSNRFHSIRRVIDA